MEERITEDTLFNGRLHCRQHADGYRFSVDAVLLAHFAAPGAQAKVLDLGAGCGVVSLILCYRHPRLTVTALELQPGLAGLIRENIILNGLQERLFLQEGDLRRMKSLFAAESFDWMVANPPYGRIDAGRINPSIEAAAARHEINADLAEVVAATSYVLKNRGRAALVYPASRAAVLLAALKNARLEPKKLQIVHSYPGDEGRLVLVEAVKNGGEELLILPPFFIYEEPSGSYSVEMQKLYAP